MKKYLLSENLFYELVFGSDENKKLITESLSKYVQKNESFYISIFSLDSILKKEIDTLKKEQILFNINQLCDDILTAENSDLSLAVGLEKELSIPYSNALELIIAQKNQIHFILDSSNSFSNQKMISVIRLVLKSE